MTHTKALELRDILNYLFTLGNNQYYFVAIRKTYPTIDSSEWEVCLYGGVKDSSFLIDLGTLAKAIDSIVPQFRAYVGTYDAGTTSEDLRTCFIIR